jgi:hypothetical protein
MELFELDPKTRQLVTSPKIWIYFVTSICATIVTAALYCVMAGFPRLKRAVEIGCERSDSHVPRSLQRGYTDIEKNPGSSVQGIVTAGAF